MIRDGLWVMGDRIKVKAEAKVERSEVDLVKNSV